MLFRSAEVVPLDILSPVADPALGAVPDLAARTTTCRSRKPQWRRMAVDGWRGLQVPSALEYEKGWPGSADVRAAAGALGQLTSCNPFIPRTYHIGTRMQPLSRRAGLQLESARTGAILRSSLLRDPRERRQHIQPSHIIHIDL